MSGSDHLKTSHSERIKKGIFKLFIVLLGIMFLGCASLSQEVKDFEKINNEVAGKMDLYKSDGSGNCYNIAEALITRLKAEGYDARLGILVNRTIKENHAIVYVFTLDEPNNPWILQMPGTDNMVWRKSQFSGLQLGSEWEFYN